MKSFRNLLECVALEGVISNLPTGTQAAGTTLPGQEELSPSSEQILHDNESSQVKCDTFRASSLFLDLPEDVALKCLAHVSRSDFPSVSKVCKAWRSQMQTKDFYLTRKAAGLLEEWLYCFISVQDVTGEWLFRWEVLNPKHSGDWKALRHIPGLVRVGSCTIVVNEKLMVIGGKGRPWTPSMKEGRSATSDVYIYDPVLDKWTRGASMKEVRYEFGCGVLDGKVYVFGGLGNHSKVLCSVEVYDPENDEWISAPPLRMPRLKCFAAGVGGKLYVVGGQGSLHLDSSPDPFMDVLDPETGQWQDLKNDCGLVLANAVVNGKIFFVEWKDSQTLRCYDTADNSWSRITMPFHADNYGVCLGTYEGKLQFFPKLLLHSSRRPSDTIVYDPEAPKGSEWQKSPMILRGGCLSCESMTV